MAFGARGSARDFGMKGGLALPVIEREHYAKTGQLMPHEKKGSKKHFSVEHEGDGTRKKRQSIAERIRNWFKRKPDPPPPDYERNTLPRRPNSAQLAPIQEQVEDEDEREEIVAEGEADNPSQQSQTAAEGTGRSGTDNEVVVRSRRKAPDRSKAYSTAFEHTSPTTQAVPIIDKVHLTLQSPDTGPRKAVLQRRQDDDTFGFHLSGGQPPITITYVKPKSVADKRGVKVGDVVLDLNGINCRKRVEISQLMKMKFMFQQPRRSSIDEQSEPVVKTKVSATKVKKRDSQEIGDPLATSSPIKSVETSEHKERANGSKKKGKKKKSTEKQEGEGDASLNDVSVPSPSAEPDLVSVSEGKKSKSKKKKGKEENSSTIIESSSPKADVVHDKKKGEKKKKRLSAIDSSENEDVGASGNGRSLEPVILSVDVEPTPTESVVVEDDDVEEALKQIEQSTMQEEELNLQKMDRNRRSTSPKSRYQMGASEAAEDKIDEVTPIPKKKKTKKTDNSSTSEVNGSKKAKNKKKADTTGSEENGQMELEDVKKKKKKSTPSKKASKKATSKAEDPEPGSEENDQKESEDVKKKKKKSTPSKQASKKATSKAEDPEPEQEVDVQLKMPVLSAAVSGSFESDTMEFVPKSRESRKGTANKEDDTKVPTKEEDDADASKDLAKKGKKKKKKGDDLDYQERTQSLKREKKKKSVSQSQSASAIRRGSVDQGVAKHSMSNSQSFSSVEEQKKFREELKEASKSEHNLDELVGSLDSNLKVKKSGLVKGKSTSSSRPSIFNQSSSPEPETSQNSLNISDKDLQLDGSTDDGLPDPDFKLKKSGVVVGKKTSASGPRPSILDEQSNAAYSDVMPGEMKYNKDVEMDLNSVPQVAPSLGLVAGRDRRDANNRSLTKRRPPSLRQTSQEAEAEAYQTSTASRMAAAKKLFENKAGQESPSRFNGRPLSKSVEKPPKALGVPSESTTAAKVQDKPAPRPVSSWASKTPSADSSKEGSVPSWVSKAQGVQKRSSTLDTTPQPSKTNTAPQASKTTPPSASTSKDGIPSVGHVAARRAMFQ